MSSVAAMPPPARSPSREMFDKVMEAKNMVPRSLNVASLLINFVLNAALWYFEIAAMETSPDESLLPGNCSTEWNLLHKLLLVTMAGWLLMTLGQCHAFVKNVETKEEMDAMQSSIVCKVITCGTSLCMLYSAYVWYCGFSITLFHYDLKDISQCEVLHNMAWWIFVVGYILTELLVLAVPTLIMSKVASAVSARSVAAPAADEEEGPGYVRIEE